MAYKTKLPALRTILGMFAGVLLVVVMPAKGLAAGGGGEASLITDIGVATIFATGLGILASLIRQPPILAYMLAGAILGPRIGLSIISSEQTIEVISEIGLILLLFIIGLEIDIKKLLKAGKAVILSGVMQFVLCVGMGLLFFRWLGVGSGEGLDVLYLSVGAALSSTMIVVKLLYDKSELDTLPGRITVGILVFQDIWAILFLSLQPNLANPQVATLLAAVVKGGLLITLTFLGSQYFLPTLFKMIAKSAELMLVTSLAWCFLVAGAAKNLGLSLEMGALLAGVSISALPYSLDVTAKVINIRDFFVTLFFVALGMKIPHPTLGPILAALAVSVFIIFSRFATLFPLLSSVRMGHRVSILTSLNLGQISEFALVIIALGSTYGHVSEELIPVVVYALVITATTSSYIIRFSHEIQAQIARGLVKAGLKDVGETIGTKAEEPRAITILGFYKVASSLVAEIEREDPDLLKEIQVVDFNPEVAQNLKDRGIAVLYGDISHMDSLHHAGIHHSSLIISTIPDVILKGTDNSRLLQIVRKVAPHAKVIVTSDSIDLARELYIAGADYVLLPRVLTAKDLLQVIEAAKTNRLEAMREEHMTDLSTRDEVLAR